ncbi:unnamed protein product, partial [Coccothraustes coccothraustes]
EGRKPRPPIIDVFQSCPSPDLVELLCLVTDFAPPTLTVDWLMDDEVIEPGHAHTEPAAPGHAPGTFRTVSRLNVSAADWRDREIFSCRVTHRASGSVRLVTAARCQAPAFTPIAVFVVPPSPSDLYISQAPKLLCLVTNLPSDAGLVVAWRREDGGALGQPGPLRLTSNFNGTYTAASELPLPAGAWEDGAAFVCRVEHAELPAPLERRVERRRGKRFPPSVFVFPPPPEEISSSLPTLSLTCLARGFFPDSIDLQWQKNPGSAGNPRISGNSPQNAAEGAGPARREPGGEGRYFLYSRLPVTREEWERGDAFVCTVVHEGLPLRFLQRSLSKGPGLELPPDLCREEPGGDPWDTLGVFVTLFLLSVGYGATVTLCK